MSRFIPTSPTLNNTQKIIPSPLSPVLRSPVNSPGQLSPRTSPIVSPVVYKSPNENMMQLSPVLPKPTLVIPRSLDRSSNILKEVAKKVEVSKIRSNDWNLAVDKTFHLIKHHGVTHKLINMLLKKEWSDLEHILRRALLISAVRWDVGCLMSLILLIEELKVKHAEHIKVMTADIKHKLKELVHDEDFLKELSKW